MYRVVSAFRDLKNREHLYEVGDEYPVEGYKPTKARIKELAEGKNAYNRVFIVEEKPENESDVKPENEGGDPDPSEGNE